MRGSHGGVVANTILGVFAGGVFVVWATWTWWPHSWESEEFLARGLERASAAVEEACGEVMQTRPRLRKSPRDHVVSRIRETGWQPSDRQAC